MNRGIANCWSSVYPQASKAKTDTVSIAAHSAPPVFLFSRIALAGLLLVTACGSAPQITTPPPIGESHEFAGTWTAAGSRNSIRLGADRRASTANLEGSLLLSGPAKPAVGFRAEALVLSDTATGMVGRAVWTDEHGDQLYSELKGQGTAASNSIVGTFLGGTGRYFGATGGYEFSWRFILESEDGTVQGQSIGLKGQVRVSSSQGAADAGGPR